MAAKRVHSFVKLRRELENGDCKRQRRDVGPSVSDQLLEFAEDKTVQLNYSQQKINLPASVRSTFLCVFSSNRELVASTHGDHKIYISELKSGKVVQTLEGHPRTPWCLAFHPSLKNIVASGCLAGEVRVWDLQSGACEVWINAHGSVIASLAFHPIDHVILIATYNELHFWDWRQSNMPFLTLTTSSEKEKVRFVKFDSLGTKIITGISNIPPIRSSGHSLHSFVDRRVDPLSDPAEPSSASSMALRRSTLLSRVMNMYRQLEGLEETRPANSGLVPSPADGSPDDVNPVIAGRVWERITANNQDQVRLPPADVLAPEPSLSVESEARLTLARDYLSRLNQMRSSATVSPATVPVAPETSSYPLDHANNLMGTFRRLHSLCTRLAQLMQEQSPRLSERNRDVRSSEATTSLNDLLSRLQQSLQNMSTAALTTAIAQEHIQQVRQRVAEILERLVNVSGYRARLSSLRDQIYEVAERIAAGSEPELGGTQRWDLIHCLWLVDMSIHLTRQMQRILAADYRLTQLTLNSSQPSAAAGSASESSNVPEVSTDGTSTRSSTDSESSLDTAGDPIPSTSSGAARARFHPYSRWLVRSRSTSSNNILPLAEAHASFSIPQVRISSAEDASPDESSELPAFPSTSRPRSPPLPEIQQVLNASSSSASAASSMAERVFHLGASAAAPPLRQPPQHHIWFSGGVGWPMTGPGGPEFGLLNAQANVSYRIQCWDFSNFELPNLKDAQAQLVVPKCRIHNDASVDISSDGNLLASLVPVDSSHSVNLCIYSLEKDTFAQCLYEWTFGANAISVSLSPLARYVVIGLTSPRSPHIYSYPPATESATVAQVLKLSGHAKSSRPLFEHVRNIDVARGDDLFSLNSIRWLPGPGEGLIYGTNRGHLVMCRPESNEIACDKQKSGASRLLTRNSATTGTQTHSPLGRLSIGTQTSEAPPQENINASDSD